MLWTVVRLAPVRGIFQARILEWVAISSSRGTFWPRDGTCISCVYCIGRWIPYHCTTWEPSTSFLLINWSQGAAIFFALSQFCVLRNFAVHSKVYSRSANISCIHLLHDMLWCQKISCHNLVELKSAQERPSWIDFPMIKYESKPGLSVSTGFI